ncbi:unnamed protein product [Urochloa decumbens]|uniref:Uncharacterized protein n=1 Tax=Urochloa decumbens TaxID=240449 RepID=A0ABC8W8L3_9POAL
MMPGRGRSLCWVLPSFTNKGKGSGSRRIQIISSAPPPTPLAAHKQSTRKPSTMDLATEALGNLLPKLAQLLKDEYILQTGTKKDIEFLSSELETIRAAIRKVGEVPREELDDLQRIWARDAREMSYDMEDIVDAFMVRVQGPDPHSKSSAGQIFNLKYMIQKFTKFMARREVGQAIRDIKERARELAERRDRYKVDDIAASKKTTVDPRLKALYTEATEIVGIEEAKKQVIAGLADEGYGGQQKKIVSIAGFGGLGKTTLAKAVYNELKGQFDCTAFVSVSRNPEAKKLLKDILYELHKGGHPSANLDEIKHLIDLIRDFLRNRRYLIVIDDIWEKEPWDKVIGLALMENNMRSRIITTTRIIGVAEHIGGCYRLKPLCDESSERLFYGRICGSKDKCPRQFSEVSKSIMKKCGGVPLAIITTSSLLANKSEDIRVWNDVCNSIGSGLGRNPGMDDMRKMLLLSYYDLPSHLKTCLLYLSIFPEDYKIKKDRLIWRWVAEGFVQQDQQQAAGDQSFLEIGESYFNELLNRSLIQPVDIDGNEGTPRACRVHDIVLDLIISLSVEECFVTTVLGDGMESKQVRRLSLHNKSASWPTMKMPKLRSLTIFTPAGAVIDPTPSLSCYLLLRVLDLRGCELNDLSSLGFVGSLSHLRYLGLSGSTNSFDSPDQLPEELGKLRFLQALDLCETRVAELPSSVITGLEQLMCLLGGIRLGYVTRLPDGLKKLTSLEVLQQVVVTSGCIAQDLGHLTQLRVLDVRVTLSTEEDDDDGWTACGDALLESLGKLTKVTSLRIIFNSNTVSLDGSMTEQLGNLSLLSITNVIVVPTWITPAFLPVLSHLDIVVHHERRDDIIQVFGTLRCLRHLRYRVNEKRVVERCAVGSDAFPCVVSCELDAVHVVPCTFPRGAMPMLQDYKFSIGREQLLSMAVEDLGLGLGHLPSLRSVTVYGLDIYNRDDEAIKNKIKGVKEKLEQEAAAHPNHPLRIHGRFDF